MGLKFEDLPVNTLVGADWKTFKELTKNQTIDKGYRGKYYLTKSVCRLLSSLKTLSSSSVTGAAARHSFTTCLRATTISATLLPIKRCSRTSCFGDSLSLRKVWRH